MLTPSARHRMRQTCHDRGQQVPRTGSSGAPCSSRVSAKATSSEAMNLPRGPAVTGSPRSSEHDVAYAAGCCWPRAGSNASSSRILFQLLAIHRTGLDCDNLQRRHAALPRRAQPGAHGSPSGRADGRPCSAVPMYVQSSTVFINQLKKQTLSAIRIEPSELDQLSKPTIETGNKTRF